jgi:hypothetical protein
MYRLSRLVKRGAVGEEPLPPAFPSWTERGMLIRRSSVHLFSGQSGSFKTTVMLNALINMKVPTLAFSTDSDDTTVASRLLGATTRQATAEVEKWLSPSSPRLGDAVRHLEPLDFIRWDFTPSPSMDDIWHSVYAYATTDGDWPELIVIDIASDVGHDTGDEWGSLRDLMRQAKVLARETRAAVILVHHCGDAFTPTMDKPVPSKRDVMGKISFLPVLMVNFGIDPDGDLWAACVKNRHAKADATARNRFRMRVDAATSFVGDWIPGLATRQSHQGEDWWQQ